MIPPSSPRKLSVLATLAAVLLACLGTAQAQTLLYSATTLPAPAQADAVHFMQLISLPQGPGTYTLSSFTIGVNYITATTATQGIVVSFFNDVDTSPTSPDALASFSLANPSALSGIVTGPGVTGNQTYTFPINTTYTLNLTGTAVGVEIMLLDGAFTNYSSDIVGRFSAVPPTVGSSVNYVWNDAGATFDNVFSGSEQTTFGQTGAYMRFALSGVPEPGTWAMMLVGGLVAVVVVVRRRLA